MLPKAVALIALLPFFASAGWQAHSKIDEFTDEVSNYATYDDAEHQLQVSREGESVWMFISQKGVHTFEPNGLIEMRVDKHTTRETDPAGLEKLGKLTGKELYQWEPSTVGFLVWHGKEQQNDDCGFISELLDGKQLRIRYQINSLEKRSFNVSLTGSKNAIINGLNLKYCGG